MLNLDVYPGPSRRPHSVPECVVLTIVDRAAAVALTAMTIGKFVVHGIAYSWLKTVQITARKRA